MDCIDDPVNLYLTEVAKIPQLSKREEARRVRLIQAGGSNSKLAVESAENDLAEANLALVVSIAQRYRCEQVHILDLIMAGNNGLLYGVKNLGQVREGGFTAHIAGHIEGAIMRAVASSSASG